MQYAISIHRSQGLTLDRAVVDIGESEFAIGLTYVALSRVKSIEGLLLEPSFPLSRLLKVNTKSGIEAKNTELERLLSLQ